MDKRDFEFTLLKQFVNLKKECKSLQLQNADIIGVDFKELEVRFFDHGSPEKFFFTIKNPHYVKQPPKSLAYVHYQPRHINDKGEYQTGVEIENVSVILKNWTNLVREYAILSLDVDDEFLDQYQKEYFIEYEILEPDANSAPFSDVQQKYLYYKLESIEEAIIALNETDIQVDAIISETRKLREKIPTLTKNQAMYWYSRIKAMVKIKGLGFSMRLAKKIGEILLTKEIEKLLEFAMIHAPKWISNIF